jgi:hypothetical protein
MYISHRVKGNPEIKKKDVYVIKEVLLEHSKKLQKIG